MTAPKKTHWSNPRHPMWLPVNMIVVFAGVTGFLYLNATNFDVTEWKAIGGIMTSIGGWKAVELFLQRRTNSNSDER